MVEGMQLCAPTGFKALQAGVRYHFLHRSEGRVVFAHFSEKPTAAHLTYLTCTEFDYANGQGLVKLLEREDVARLPPWLKSREKEVFDESPASNDEKLGAVWPDWKVVGQRVDLVADAVDECADILSQIDPIRALNRYAMSAEPVQNTGRFRLFFITYIAFGRNRWALLPAPAGRGKYLRDKCEGPAKRFGRPHRDGAQHGHNVTPALVTLMVKGFKRFARKGKSLSFVYRRTLVKVMGCKWAVRDDETYIFHPKGDPFPTYGQFNYWLVKVLSHEVVWSKLWGAVQYRNTYAATQGSYSEGLQDVLEKVYSDAAAFSDYPRSYVLNAPSLPLYEIPAVCGLTGLTVGISFAVGGEAESGYKQALAFMALPKSLMSEVFGVPLSERDWPITLMPRGDQTDRGAGAAKSITKLNQERGISRDMTPSYAPQSNSPVEAQHRRSPSSSGQPTHCVSKLTAIEMVQHRLKEVESENRARLVTNRLTPEQLALGIKSPLQLCHHYLKEGRVQGVQMAVEDVITGYLPKIEFEIKDGKLTRKGVVYRSAEFSACKFGREIRKHEGDRLNGHSFEICNRVVWVIVDKKLVEVRAIPNVREHESVYLMGEHEMDAHHKLYRDNRAGAAGRRHAESVRSQIEAEELTGKPLMASITKTGRARVRTPAARQELAAMRAA